MDKKEAFKEFVKKNPKLITYVRDGKATWQKFYEMYDLYGASSSVWDKYIKSEVKTSDIINWLKNIDIDKVEENINSIRRVLSVLSDVGKNKDTEVSSYTPRPLYRHFED